jgi:hypothetical protein
MQTTHEAGISPDDVLDRDDNKRLAQIVTAKKHIYSFINQKPLLDFILARVDGSGYLKFERQSDRRFLRLAALNMALTIDIAKCGKKHKDLADKIRHGGRDVDGYDEVVDARSEAVRRDVVLPFVDLMAEMFKVILGSDCTEANAEWINQILPEDIETLKKTVSNILEIKEEKDRVRLQNEYGFLFRLGSALSFAKKEPGVDLDDDPTFALEYLI